MTDLTSGIGHRPSAIEHRTSNIEHRASKNRTIVRLFDSLIVRFPDSAIVRLLDRPMSGFSETDNPVLGRFDLLEVDAGHFLEIIDGRAGAVLLAVGDERTGLAAEQADHA